MILRRVELYSPKLDQYITYEALIDTGATVCVIAKHIAENMGLQPSVEKIHLWQVRDPLALERTRLNIRYKSKNYTVEAVMVEIPDQFQRSRKPGEECTRPKYRNPLTKRIILGENFLKLLSLTEMKDITTSILIKQ